ncbi:MAG: hypothetical protein NTW96_11645 [Planctomycetia bacterium]|jgi:hypothetical protein|nr:hypothetical protein [Planctomycetia bacterium]
MSKHVFFVRECPTCGRHLHIRVEYLGKKVVCQHCHGKLEARDPAAADGPIIDPAQSILLRAEALLQGTANENAARNRVQRPR